MKISIKPTLEEIPALLHHISSWLVDYNLDVIKINQLKVVIDEIVSNTINHGMKSSTDLEFSLELTLNSDQITLTFTDNGIPFNPLLLEDPIHYKDISEAKVGGFGIYIFKNLTDQSSYSFQNGYNILTLVKKLTKT